MTLITKHLENMNTPHIRQMESELRFKENQERIMNQNNQTLSPIIDMRKQMEQVRKSKVTLNQSMVNGTTSRRYK